MDRIEKELSARKRRIWLQRIMESKLAITFIVLFVIALSWSVYQSTDKVIENDKIYGVLIGMHQVQGNLGSSTTKLSIKLNNGDTVLVTAPDNFVVRDGAEVNLVRDKTEHGSVYYHFVSYRDSIDQR